MERRLSDPADESDGLDFEDEPVADEEGDFAEEHARVIVDDFRLDRPAESDAMR
jgi:hypothetical protein